MLPDKTTKCHRTGFQETCFKCVTEHNCRLWKHVTLEHHPETGVPGVSHYDCVDSLQDLYLKDMLRRQVQTTATVDSLRKEVQQANDAGMANALMGINQQIRAIGGTLAPSLPPADTPKLLEN
jgi:hypothetical protein